MNDKRYDVLISYRRDYKGEDGTKHSNIPTARAVESQFSKRGYEVFLDMEKCTDGRFEDEIIPAIKTCVYFVLLLTKDSLKRCQNEGDWVRREIEVALRSPCKIIIVTPDGEVPACPKGLPASIASIDGIEISDIGVSRKSFSSDIDFLINTRMGSPVVKKDNRMNRMENCAKLKVKSNLDCLMYVDEEECANLTANKLEKIPLRPGEYMLKFESVENMADYIEEEYTMPVEDRLKKVDLLSIKQAREQREQEERERKEKERQEKERKEREERERKERERQEKERKEREERERKEREARGEFEVKGVKFKMIYVEGGTFMMGATEEQWFDAYDREKPAHKVTLSDYYIGETVVTQELWKALMGKNLSFFRGEVNLPVENVSWKDVQRFIAKLNKETGRVFRLPTEAEWEFAARGGKKSKGYKYSGSNFIDEVAWYEGNSGDKTHPVKGKNANELGLYDMSGNVWEWCNDWYGGYSSYAQTNPQGPEDGSRCVVRGGSWGCSERNCRVSVRDIDTPSYRFNFIGFRLVVCP